MTDPVDDTGLEPDRRPRRGLPRWAWLVLVIVAVLVLLFLVLQATGVLGGEGHTPGPPPGGH